jgi:hypothetical protein
MQQQHLPIFSEAHRLSVSPKAADQKRAIVVTMDQETVPGLCELDICGLAAL